MASATPVYQLPFPVPADPADVPADMQALANRIEAVIAPGSASGQIPIWDNAAHKWTPGTPPAQGAELVYVEGTAAIVINTVTQAAITIVTAGALTLDGSTPIWVEFFAPQATLSGAASQGIQFWLWDGSTSLGVVAQVVGASAVGGPVIGRRKLTPSAGSHTYSIRANSLAAGSNSVGAGTGPGGYVPLYIRATRV
jgi:hypothetical protein